MQHYYTHAQVLDSSDLNAEWMLLNWVTANQLHAHKHRDVCEYVWAHVQIQLIGCMSLSMRVLYDSLNGTVDILHTNKMIIVISNSETLNWAFIWDWIWLGGQFRYLTQKLETAVTVPETVRLPRLLPERNCIWVKTLKQTPRTSSTNVLASDQCSFLNNKK